MYADDVILLADSWRDAQNKLNELNSCCEVNMLNVNIEKTKAVIFRRSRRIKTNRTLRINDDPITIANNRLYDHSNKHNWASCIADLFV